MTRHVNQYELRIAVEKGLISELEAIARIAFPAPPPIPPDPSSLYVCRFCSRDFETLCRLEQHCRDTNHPYEFGDLVEETHSMNVLGEYVCHECSRSFQSLAARNQHLESSGHSPFPLPPGSAPLCATFSAAPGSPMSRTEARRPAGLLLMDEDDEEDEEEDSDDDVVDLPNDVGEAHLKDEPHAVDPDSTPAKSLFEASAFYSTSDSPPVLDIQSFVDSLKSSPAPSPRANPMGATSSSPQFTCATCWKICSSALELSLHMKETGHASWDAPSASCSSPSPLSPTKKFGNSPGASPRNANGFFSLAPGGGRSRSSSYLSTASAGSVGSNGSDSSFSNNVPRPFTRTSRSGSACSALQPPTTSPPPPPVFLRANARSGSFGHAPLPVPVDLGLSISGPPNLSTHELATTTTTNPSGGGLLPTPLGFLPPDFSDPSIRLQVNQMTQHRRRTATWSGNTAVQFQRAIHQNMMISRPTGAVGTPAYPPPPSVVGGGLPAGHVTFDSETMKQQQQLEALTAMAAAIVLEQQQQGNGIPSQTELSLRLQATASSQQNSPTTFGPSNGRAPAPPTPLLPNPHSPSPTSLSSSSPAFLPHAGFLPPQQQHPMVAAAPSAMNAQRWFGSSSLPSTMSGFPAAAQSMMPGQIYRCMECGKEFKAPNSLQQHCNTTQHLGYECQACQLRLPSRRALEEHTQTCFARAFEQARF